MGVCVMCRGLFLRKFSVGVRVGVVVEWVLVWRNDDSALYTCTYICIHVYYIYIYIIHILLAWRGWVSV